MRERDPALDEVGQGDHLLVGGADAQQHRREFLLGDVAVEQVGDLAAQERLLEGVWLHGKEVREIDLLAAACSREIEKVRLLQEGPGASAISMRSSAVIAATVARGRSTEAPAAP